jgi:peptidoglycan/LPS O-acetylase OafA/YrhL
MAERRLPHFAELDGIRGLAALTVFIHHFFGIGHENADTVINVIASFGYLGVQVFFVLSGFLITSLLFIDRRKPHVLRDFYWKRVLRIWPALLIYLCAAYALSPLNQTAYVVMSLLFVSNFASLFGTTEFGGTWSLAIEEQFYLLWPHVIRRCRVNTVFSIGLWVFVISVSLRTVLPILRNDTISMPYTPYQCDGLALGALLACQWFAPDQLERRAKWVSQLLNGNMAILVWIFLLGLEIWLYPMQGRRNINISIQMTLVTFASYRLIALIVLKRDRRLSWLGGKPLVLLGSISYGLYLYHGVVLDQISERLGNVNVSHPFATIMRFVLGLAASIAISFASLRFVELPIRRLRKYVIRAKVRPVETA